MKLLICFKIVPELDHLSNQEWVEVAADQDLSYVKRIISCYDEAALETALKIADEGKKLNIPVELTALTIAPSHFNVNTFLQNLYAVKFDCVVKISTDQDVSFSPEIVSNLIADYSRLNGGFDAILMGRQANIGDHGMTHAFSAESLHMLYIPYTLELQLTEKGLLSQNKTDTGLRNQLLNSPAIYAMDNINNTYLRVTTLKEKLAAKKKQIIEIKKTISTEINNPFNIFRDGKERSCTFLQGDSAKEKANHLYHLYLKDVIEQ